MNVSWSKKALAELDQTLRFWAEHNTSVNYSLQLRNRAVDVARFLANNPESGNRTNRPNVRWKMLDAHFMLLYRINKRHLQILRFWDTRRNPRNVRRWLG